MSIAGSVQTIVRAGLKGAIAAAVAAATTAAPLLGVPVIKQIFAWVVNKVVDWVYPFIEVLYTDKIIDIEVEAERKAYVRARDELQKILESKIEDQKLQQETSDEFDRRLAELIRIKQ